tara:strand:- start:1174 stop:2316 length:1143 start_codon:yes stop_codon:yes gene_type:complete
MDVSPQSRELSVDVRDSGSKSFDYTLEPAESPRSDEDSSKEPSPKILRVVKDFVAKESGDINLYVGELVVLTDESPLWCDGTKYYEGYIMDDPEKTKGLFPAICVLPETRERVRVENPDFVPEGWHGEYRDETGGLKVNEKNKESLKDIDHFIRIYKEDGWGTQPGIIYNRENTRLADGCRLPTHEILMSLSLKGVELYGKILMKTDSGKIVVYDADSDREVENLGQKDMPIIMSRLVIRKEWEKGVASDPRFVPEVIDVKEDFNEFQETGYGIDPTTGLLNGKIHSQNFKIPKGVYKKKKRTFKRHDSGIAMFSCCDEPSCCVMTKAVINICASGQIPCDQNREIMEFIKNRIMFEKIDDINGNVDMCYHCLSKTRKWD